MEQPDLDRYLDEVLIGGREQSRISLSEYDPSWPARFEAERQRIEAALGRVALGVEHIGSTAVPGLAAKPIVDVLLIVADVDDEPSFLGPLEAVGYELRVREPGHRMLRDHDRTVNLHVRGDADPEILLHLRFRDHLRRSPADRRRYEQRKRALAAREWPDVNHYADAKGPVIESILARAANPDEAPHSD